MQTRTLLSLTVLLILAAASGQIVVNPNGGGGGGGAVAVQNNAGTVIVAAASAIRAQSSTSIGATVTNLGSNVAGIQFSLNPGAVPPICQPFSFDGQGAVLPTGDTLFYPIASSNWTVSRIDVTGSPSGSFTMDIWKAAGAIPTAANKISASAPITLSSSQTGLNGSLTGWSTAVATGDVWGFSIASATTVTKVQGQICGN